MLVACIDLTQKVLSIKQTTVPHPGCPSHSPLGLVVLEVAALELKVAHLVKAQCSDLSLPLAVAVAVAVLVEVEEVARLPTGLEQPP